jgi:hypothetical protein
LNKIELNPSENNLELTGMPYLSQMWQQYWPHLTNMWAQTHSVVVGFKDLVKQGDVSRSMKVKG